MLLDVFIYVVAMCKATEKGLKYTKSPVVKLPLLKQLKPFTDANIIECGDKAEC